MAAAASVAVLEVPVAPETAAPTVALSSSSMAFSWDVESPLVPTTPAPPKVLPGLSADTFCGSEGSSIVPPSPLLSWGSTSPTCCHSVPLIMEALSVAIIFSPV